MAPVQLEDEPRYVLVDDFCSNTRKPFFSCEHHLPDLRLIPTLLALSRFAVTVYTSITVGWSLYQSHKALGPAQDTRHRQADRTKLTIAFGGLASLALVSAFSSGWDYLRLSYRVWASERGIEAPEL